MEICNLERGKGKTTYLTYRSHITQYPVVCADYMFLRTEMLKS